MDKLPKVSIITPSYNQAEFIERTILSVLDQGYPNIEYIVFDGGSTDDSIDIIKKYQDKIAYWVSEPDRGQTHAINKGFKRATGEICAWLNSDDLYMENAVSSAVNYFLKYPEVDLLYSHCLNIDENDGIINLRICKDYNRESFISYPSLISQPATFWRKSLFEKIGYLEENYDYVMDLEFWLRAANSGCNFMLVRDKIFAAFRLYPNSKCGGINLGERSDHNDKLFDEAKEVFFKYGGKRLSSYYFRLLAKRYQMFKMIFPLFARILYIAGR